MTPSNPSEQEPVPSPEAEGQELAQPEKIESVEKKEQTIEEKIEARANNRNYRDSFIEREEPRWYTEAKKAETIEKEKIKFREGLEKNAGKIEAGIKIMKEPMKRIEEMPRFLKACGLDEKEIHGFEEAFPIGHESIAPQNKHMAVAIFDAINKLFENRASLTEGSFSSLALEIFARKRMESFVADQTVFAKYEDSQGMGFYRSKEGEAFVRQNLRAEMKTEGAGKA
jgi:hypothetical protein